MGLITHDSSNVQYGRHSKNPVVVDCVLTSFHRFGYSSTTEPNETERNLIPVCYHELTRALVTIVISAKSTLLGIIQDSGSPLGTRMGSNLQQHPTIIVDRCSFVHFETTVRSIQ